jgi:hypothetical protein
MARKSNHSPNKKGDGVCRPLFCFVSRYKTTVFPVAFRFIFPKKKRRLPLNLNRQISSAIAAHPTQQFRNFP